MQHRRDTVKHTHGSFDTWYHRKEITIIVSFILLYTLYLYMKYIINYYHCKYHRLFIVICLSSFGIKEPKDHGCVKQC